MDDYLYDKLSKRNGTQKETQGGMGMGDGRITLGLAEDGMKWLIERQSRNRDGPISEVFLCLRLAELWGFKTGSVRKCKQRAAGNRIRLP
jgi:hypothetical protein